MSDDDSRDLIEWYENDGNQNFILSMSIGGVFIDGPTSIYITDVDSDGDMDMLLTSRASNLFNDDMVILCENDGNQNFYCQGITIALDDPGNGYATDLDSDGDIDLICTSDNNNVTCINWFENDGSQNFTTHTITTSAIVINPYDFEISATDFDNDGDMDVVSYGAWYENDGNQNFTTQVNSGASPVFTDLDGDGDIDGLGYGAVWCASIPSACIAWYENDSNQNFMEHTITAYEAGVYTNSICTADIDGDSDMDVISGGTLIRLHENIGTQITSATDTQIACNSYTWIDGNTYTTSNNSATYNIVGGASNGCDSLVNLNLTINYIDNSITNSSPTLFANSTSATYQWLDCDNNYAHIPGETGQSFTATSNGNYAVEVTENNCTDTSVCETVNNVSILENSFIVIPKLFPNPTTGKLTLELDNAYDNITINVRNVSGKLVSTYNYKSTKNITFEIKEARGVYIIEVSNQQGNSAKLRVIKK